jgi:hypothetical protein
MIRKDKEMRYMIIFLLCSSILLGDYNEKGMRVYKKRCKPCHGSGDYAAVQLEQSAWEDYFIFKASKLKKAHQKVPKIVKSIASLSKARLGYLEEFLVQNAKDSGSVGGCDGNRCGIKKGDIKIKK